MSPMFKALGLRILGFRVQGWRFRVLGLMVYGFRILGFKVLQLPETPKGGGMRVEFCEAFRFQMPQP